MQITIQADARNKKNILTLIEETGCRIPCNCHGKHRCPGRYSFDCAMIPKTPVTVTLPDTEQDIHGIALENRPLIPGPADTLLADLGTTTIALVLMDKKSGDLRQSCVFLNPQHSFGADVVSRIQASCEGQGTELTAQIRETLQRETTLLCQKNGQTSEDITLCMIGGNTTMIHLLMGYDCSPLATSPFIPREKSPAPFSADGTEVRIMPWLSAFVGGDITAGIHACGLENTEDTRLLIDLGTNGEMVLSLKGHLYAAATAAGPALEGGCLSCGCAAVPGAISQVRLQRGLAQTATIDNKIPVGLCGSGALTLCAELLRYNLLSPEGILSDSFPADGIFLGRTADGRSLHFLADDLRQLQLAIASIGAGIDTVCKEAGILPESIECLYVGGGFGFFLPIEDGILLRMLPNLSPDNIHITGNTCLQGLYLCSQKDEKTHMVSLPYTIVNLAAHPYYKERFLHHMTYDGAVSSTTNS